MDNNATSLFNQCCTDTDFAHTLYSYGSSLSWVRGRQIWKFGWEQRLFFNDFFQPNPPTGFFHFTQGVTEEVVGGGNPIQGNSFASLLLGYGDTDSSNDPSSLSAFKPVANKSKETAFYFQDDWKINSKLTVNLGSALRMEHALHGAAQSAAIQRFYERQRRGSAVLGAGTCGRDRQSAGHARFSRAPGNRHMGVDRNNVAPRLGFAYALDSNTVIRGGAGIYYGLNVATNFQFTGTAFGNTIADSIYEG